MLLTKVRISYLENVNRTLLTFNIYFVLRTEHLSRSLVFQIRRILSMPSRKNVMVSLPMGYLLDSLALSDVPPVLQ